MKSASPPLINGQNITRAVVAVAVALCACPCPVVCVLILCYYGICPMQRCFFVFSSKDFRSNKLSLIQCTHWFCIADILRSYMLSYIACVAPPFLSRNTFARLCCLLLCATILQMCEVKWGYVLANVWIHQYSKQFKNSAAFWGSTIYTWLYWCYQHSNGCIKNQMQDYFAHSSAPVTSTYHLSFRLEKLQVRPNLANSFNSLNQTFAY